MTDRDSYAEGWNKCADDMDKKERRVKLCPRPVNGADCNSAAWCVLAGNCGCDHGFKLMLRSARGIDDAFSDSAQQRRDAWKRVDELEGEARKLRTALQAMVNAQHAGPITDEMHEAWANARSLLTPNAGFSRG